MPELPEVETVCCGIRPYVVNRKITKVIVRNSQLRWPIAANLKQQLLQQTILGVKRRAKYLLFSCNAGTIIIHLGMTGKLTIVPSNTTIAKHDHVDFCLDNGYLMRYSDPRRFGSIHWTTHAPEQHKLLAHLGIEPLTLAFSGKYLLAKAINKSITIKNLLMNAAIVVGIGNIYANEALFYAGIKPTRSAKTLALAECNLLVKYIKIILKKAITKGGTTIKDFVNISGDAGKFAQELMVYGRSGEHCRHCNTILQSIRLNQRITVFCPHCQR